MDRCRADSCGEAVSASLSAGRVGCCLPRGTATVPLGKLTRTLVECDPCRTYIEGSGDCLDNFDAGLCAVFNVADGTRAHISPSGKLCLGHTQSSAYFLHTHSHPITSCCQTIGSFVAESVGQPSGSHIEGGSKARDHADSRQALSGLYFTDGCLSGSRALDKLVSRQRGASTGAAQTGR